MEIKGFFQFEIIINGLVSTIALVVLVYDFYKVFNYFSAGTVFRRQNLTSLDVRLLRLKSVPTFIQRLGFSESASSRPIKI